MLEERWTSGDVCGVSYPKLRPVTATGRKIAKSRRGEMFTAWVKRRGRLRKMLPLAELVKSATVESPRAEQA